MDLPHYGLVALTIAIIWGVSPVVFKYLIHENTSHPIPVYMIVLIQALVYVLCAVAYVVYSKQSVLWADLRSHASKLPLLVILSFFSVYVANNLYLYALGKGAPVSTMQLIVSLSPVFTLLFAYLILQETLTVQTGVGFFLVLTGLVFIFS